MLPETKGYLTLSMLNHCSPGISPALESKHQLLAHNTLYGPAIPSSTQKDYFDGLESFCGAPAARDLRANHFAQLL